VLHGELVILLRKHFTVSASDDIMNGPSKGLRLLRPNEISQLIDTEIEPDRTDENFKRLCKIRNVFEIVNGTSSRFTTLPKIWLLTKLLFPSMEG
jgi:hypothetical protein